jgi:SLT domain-containing protein
VPRLIGDAYIALLADASMLRPDADAKIKAALAGLRPQVTLTGNTKDIDAKIAAIAAALKGLNSEGTLGLNTDRAIADVAGLTAAVDALMARLDNIPVSMDDSRALAKLYTILSGVEGLREKLEDLGDADFDINKALAKFYTLDASAKALAADMSDLDPDMNTAAITAKMAVLRSEAGFLSEALSDLRANIDDNAALAKIIMLQGQVLGLAKSMNNMPMSADTLPIEADLLKVGAAVTAIQVSLADIKAPEAALGTFANIARVMTQESMIISNGTGFWGILNNQIRTFGGALEGILPDWLANIHVWHLGTDAIFEFAAAWGPAIIAVGAFAGYAFPVGEKIYGQWKNINTVLDGVDSGLSGTAVGLKDLGSGFDQVERAIEPSILVAFGEYMSIVTHNSASLGDALTKVGDVIDRWGAQAAAAVGGFEKSMDSIIGTGAKDFAQIGYGFEELGKILDDLFVHDMPGYVHILLDLGDAALTMTADFVQFAGPAIKIGLAIHGFIVYAGLAATAIYALGRAMVAGGIAKYAALTGSAVEEAGEDTEEATGKFNAFGTAIGAIGGLIAAGVVNTIRYTSALVALTREEGIGIAATDAFSDLLSVIPFGAVGLPAAAAAAIIGTVLYFALRNSTDAAAKFNAQIQDTVTAANAANITQVLANGLAKTADQYNKLTQQMNANASASLGTVRGLNTSGHALNDNYRQTQELLGGQQQLVQETDNYGIRMGQLAGVFGSTSAALSGLNLMNISAGTVAKETNAQWAAQLTELKALAAGYGYMSQSGSEATAQLGALNIATGTVTKNIQTLTQAESAWITMITGGDSAFTTFEQGQATLSGAMKQGAASGDTLKVSLGKLSETFPLLKTGLDGTTQSALAARQAFDSQLQAGVTLFGNLQTLATASGDTASAEKELTEGGKAILASLLPFVAGSKEGVAELSSLAQLMGGPATSSFQVLAKWIGSTKNAADILNNSQAALTISASNMTTAEKNLANQLETDVTSMEASKVATETLSGSINGLYTASVTARGEVTDTAITLSGNYVNALKKAGVGTTQATQYLNAYLTQLGYGPAAIAAIDGAMGKSQSSWEQTIGNLKLSKGEADALYHSLQTLGSGSPYIANVKTNVSASGEVSAVETGNAAYGVKNAMLGELRFQGMAAGGVVRGGVHGQDSVPAMLAPGELVVPSSHAAMLGSAAKRMGIPGFASGGYVGMNADATQIQNIVPTVGQASTQFATSAAQSFVNTVKNGMLTSGTLSGPAPITSPVIAQLIMEALNADHAPQSWLPAIELIISKESGGNAAAIDPISVLGEHAMGIMQMLPSTYEMYGGTGSITNPLSNIEAAVRYIIGEYGSPYNIQGIGRAGSYRGYSGGGAINEPVNGVGLWSGMGYSFAENGQPEYVSNGSQAAASGSSMMQPATNIGQQTIIGQNNRIIQLLAGLPQTVGKAVSQSAGAGVKSGYYSAQN